MRRTWLPTVTISLTLIEGDYRWTVRLDPRVWLYRSLRTITAEFVEKVKQRASITEVPLRRRPSDVL